LNGFIDMKITQALFDFGSVISVSYTGNLVFYPPITGMPSNLVLEGTLDGTLWQTGEEYKILYVTSRWELQYSADSGATWDTGATSSDCSSSVKPWEIDWKDSSQNIYHVVRQTA